MDWRGIHEKICLLLPPLRSPAPVIGSEHERDLRQQTLQTSRRALIDLTRNEASKFLVAGQFELAVRPWLGSGSIDANREGRVSCRGSLCADPWSAAGVAILVGCAW